MSLSVGETLHRLAADFSGPAASKSASASTRPVRQTAVGKPWAPGPAGIMSPGKPQRFAAPSIVRKPKKSGSSEKRMVMSVATDR